MTRKLEQLSAMTDPLSVIVSITSLVAVGTQLTIKIKDLSDGFRDAPKEIADMSRQLSTLCGILGRLERILKQDFDSHPPFPPDSVGDLSGVLECCMKIFIRLQGLVQKFNAYKQESVLTRFRKQLRWVLSEKELAKLCTALEAHKATLNVTLVLTQT